MPAVFCGKLPADNSFTYLAHLEYKKLQAFLVLSVQSLVTSRVLPLSRPRATGRPTMATPTIFPSFFAATENLWAMTDLWCL